MIIYAISIQILILETTSEVLAENLMWKCFMTNRSTSDRIMRPDFL